jgi:hypothetical protein
MRLRAFEVRQKLRPLHLLAVVRVHGRKQALDSILRTVLLLHSAGSAQKLSKARVPAQAEDHFSSVDIPVCIGVQRREYLLQEVFAHDLAVSAGCFSGRCLRRRR